MKLYIRVILTVMLGITCVAMLHSKEQAIAYTEAVFSYSVVEDGICLTAVRETYIEDGILVVPATYEGNDVVGIETDVSSILDTGYIKFNSSKITGLDLSEASNLRYIGARCFKNGDSSTVSGDIVLPESLEEVGKGAFSNCKLDKVYVMRSNGYTKLANNCFDSETKYIFQSQDILDMYATKDVWSDLKSNFQLELPQETVVKVEFCVNDEVYAEQFRALGKDMTYVCTDGNWAYTEYSLPTPTLMYYTFMGWYIGDKQIDETYVLSDEDASGDTLKIESRWEANKHTVSYSYDKESFETEPIYSFYEKDGLTLPSITTKKILRVCDGWSMRGSSDILSEIPVGTTNDIELYANYHDINPSISCSKDKTSYLYGEDIQFEHTLSVLPEGHTSSFRYEIFDTEWHEITKPEFKTIYPGEYKLKCIYTIQFGTQSKDIYVVVDVYVKAHQVRVEWEDKETYIFENSDIIVPVTLSSTSISTTTCEVCTYKYETAWVKKDIRDVGVYKVVVEIKDEYKDVVQILGESEKQISVEPYTVSVGYAEPVYTTVYKTEVVPEIVISELDMGFENSYVLEKVYIGDTNCVTRTIDKERSGSKYIEAVGRYKFVLSCTNANYKLESKYLSTTLTIEQQAIYIEWGNVNFEYDGNAHIPSATAKTAQGEQLGLILTGEQVNASTSSTEYEAQAMYSNSNYKLLNDTIYFSISKAKSWISYECISSKFYDCLPVAISAWVEDARGAFATNVSTLCDTDLTQVGLHYIVMSWGGDANHYASEDKIHVVTIKTDNLVYGDESSPELAILCEDGFSSTTDIVISKSDISTLPLTTESYSQLKQLYDVQTAYTLQSEKTKDVCLKFEIPDTKSVKNIRVFKTTADGKTTQVTYTISDGLICVDSSDINTTYIVAIQKTHADTITLILITVLTICTTLTALCVSAVVRRRRKAKYEGENV